MKSTLQKQLASVVLAAFAISVAASLGQNCSAVRFEGMELASSKPNNPLDTNPPVTVHCEFNGETYTEGQTVVAYQNSSVPFNQACVSEVRKCEGGNLSGSFNYVSCEPDAPKSCLFNGRTIPHNGTVDAYQNSSVAYGATCERQARVCNNGVLSGTYTFASCQPAAPASCLFNGQTVAHGAKVAAFRNSAVAFGATCEQEERVCSNGSLSGSFTYAACTPGQPSACTFNGRSVAHGETLTAFLNPSVSYGQNCESQPRTCYNGTLSGSYNYGSCEVGAPKTCLFNGQTIAHGQEVTAYQESTVAYGGVCVGQARRCDNGALTGSYTFASCNVAQPASCLFNGRTVAHGESITGFNTSRVPFGSTCLPVTRVCQNGVFTGDGSALYASCAVDEPAACLFNGQTIAHGQRVVTFASPSVPYGQSCVSEERVCLNGALSGSYTATSCESEYPRACSFNGQTIPNGSSIVTYQNAVVPFGQNCVSERRTCENGTLSGSFAQSSCTQDAAKSCVFNGQTVPHGLGVTAFQTASVPFGQSCASEVRTCNNGWLSGSYTVSACAVTPPSMCNFNGLTLAHGQTVTAYQTTSVPFGQGCAGETRTCVNGLLTGSFGASSCEAQPPANCSFGGQVVAHGGQVTAYAQPSVPYGAGCQAETRTCWNGGLSGSFGYGGCSVQPPASCTVATKFYQESYLCSECGLYGEWVDQVVPLAHGQSIKLYSTGSIGSRVTSGTCSDYYAQIRTCNNGVVSGNPAYVFQSCYVYEISGGSPLMVHFNSNVDKPEPLVFTSLIDGILFDILGRNSKPKPHTPLRISWYRSPQYYFLTLPDAKGRVRGVDELFGNNTFGPDRNFAQHGYKALAKYDGMTADGKRRIAKEDGYITKKDPVFAKLRFWHDDNFNGVAEPKELHSMEELGVEVIDLHADPRFKETDQYGNKTTLKSVVKTKDGRYHLMFDVWFNYGGPK